METRCGECGTVLAADVGTCVACGRVLGSAPPKGRRPALFVWAAVAAAIEVAATLLIMRSCG